MARDRDLEKTVTTTVRRGSAENDPIAIKIKSVIGNISTLTPGGYVQNVLSSGLATLELHVFKKSKHFGAMSKVGEATQADLDADNIEGWILQLWGAGLYQLRPVMNRQYYSPSSMLFRVGEEKDVEPQLASTIASQDDVDSVIAETTKRMGHMVVMKDLKKLSAPDAEPIKGTDMDATQVTALVNASIQPYMEMLRGEREARQRAEDRHAQLLDKLLDQRSQVQQPLFAELAKSAVAKPEILSLLMGGGASGAAEGESWISLLRDVAREFAPVMQTLVMQMMAQNGIPGRGPIAATPIPAPPLPAGRAGRTADEPKPTNTGPSSGSGEGGGPMPMDLNEEQVMSKELIVEFVKAGDFPNAFATLETFPGFMPIQGGAVPMGEYIISHIDPAASPKVYVPQLAMLIPEFRQMREQAEHFIQWVQNRLLRDDEAMKNQVNAAGGRPPGGE